MHFIKIVYMTLVKDVKAGFTTRGLLQWDFVIGREIRLNSQHDKER